MSHRAEAFKSVAEAIHLDSSGNCQVAYAKYLQSLQKLCKILADQYDALGYEKIVENPEEAKQMLSLVGECSERMDSILCLKDLDFVVLKSSPAEANEMNNHHCKNLIVDLPQLSANSTSNYSCKDLGIQSLHLNVNSTSHNAASIILQPENAFKEFRFPALEKAKKANAQLLKKFQPRIENTKDDRTKSNLKLELQRRLTENMAIARAKQTEIILQQKKEKQLLIAAAENELLSNQPYLSETDVKKKKLYVSILQFEAERVLPGIFTTKEEAVDVVYKKTFQCHGHPLSVFWNEAYMEIFHRVENTVVEYSDLAKYLTDGNLAAVNISRMFVPQPFMDEVDSRRKDTESLCELLCTPEKLSTLAECVREISSDIRSTIDEILEIFLLAYQTKLPAESESICYKVIESNFLCQLWPSLLYLYRFINLPSELKISIAMSSCTMHSSEFTNMRQGFFPKSNNFYDNVTHSLLKLSRMTSLVDKLNLLVQISRKLCGGSLTVNENCDHDKKERLLGADDLIPILCSALIRTGLPQLVSECYALEQLVDQKYMLGEEGYSLTTFQTALKYIESKKFIDEECGESSTVSETILSSSN